MTSEVMWAGVVHYMRVTWVDGTQTIESFKSWTGRAYWLGQHYDTIADYESWNAFADRGQT